MNLWKLGMLNLYDRYTFKSNAGDTGTHGWMLVLFDDVRTLLCLQGAVDEIWEPSRTTRRKHSDIQLQDGHKHFHIPLLLLVPLTYIEQS
jgi:hypothetical protein